MQIAKFRLNAAVQRHFEDFKIATFIISRIKLCIFRDLHSNAIASLSEGVFANLGNLYDL